MMTVIEKQYMESVIRLNKRLQSGEIDWEQRRYEIAKEMLPQFAMANQTTFKSLAPNMSDEADVQHLYKQLRDGAVETAVAYADALVAKLKETAEKK